MNDCPKCEYNKNRAARWRAEAYKQAGHDVIELPWVGLTNKDIIEMWPETSTVGWDDIRLIEAKLKEKNT